MPAPTRDDRFSFGLWTIGWQARDTFGDPTRDPLDPVEAVTRLAELGAYGVSFHDDDLVPFGSDDAERERRIKRFEMPWRRQVSSYRWSRPISSRTRFSRTEPSRATTATSAATRFERSCATSSLPPSSERPPTCSGVGAKAPRPMLQKMSGRRWTGTGRPSTHSPQFVIDRGYKIRFAIEPKPNEPRGRHLSAHGRERPRVHLRASSIMRWSD